jgi:hypothetical protein
MFLAVCMQRSMYSAINMCSGRRHLHVQCLCVCVNSEPIDVSKTLLVVGVFNSHFFCLVYDKPVESFRPISSHTHTKVNTLCIFFVRLCVHLFVCACIVLGFCVLLLQACGSILYLDSLRPQTCGKLAAHVFGLFVQEVLCVYDLMVTSLHSLID